MRQRLYRRPTSRRERWRVARLMAVIRDTETEVGLNNEQRVIEAFSNGYPFPHRPPWLRSVRLSTYDEDHEDKVDVVFETDCGDMRLQIKSSEYGRQQFLRAQKNGEVDPGILVVVISPFMDVARICRKVMPVLSAEHRRRTRNAANGD